MSRFGNGGSHILDGNCACSDSEGDVEQKHGALHFSLNMHKAPRKRVALVGNPNVGKSTLFNHVTGAHQKVVNAPRTTVQITTGTWKSLGVDVIDLPGTYSLVPNSADERVVIRALAERRPVTVAPQEDAVQLSSASRQASASSFDRAEGSVLVRQSEPAVDLVIAVLDGGSMTRSLYLLAQIAQAGHPVVAVVTMVDVAQQNKDSFDIQKLSALTGIPVLPFDARESKYYRALDAAVRDALVTKPRVRGLDVDPSAPGYAGSLGEDLSAESAGAGSLTGSANDEIARANQLFAWVDDVEKACGHEPVAANTVSRSDKIDRVLLNPLAGTVIFFSVLWLLFQIAGTWIGPIQDWCENIIAGTDPGSWTLANGATWVLAHIGLSGTWVEQLFVAGLISGIGVVASFFPLMFVIYVAITVLEDSGYMARAAFLGDRLMRRIGLDGRVILPLIMGFGCNVPSLAAARSIPSEKQRLVTVLVTPYTSCAARLTIYLLIGKVFFGSAAGTVVFVMYALSMVMVVLGAWVLNHVMMRREPAQPLMLVLPAYQKPRIISTLQVTWQRSWSFVSGAGKIIVVMTAIVWLMSAIPLGAGAAGKHFADPSLPMEDSLYGKTAQVLVPVFKPAGIGEWHMTGALITGFVAKETVVSSIVTSYNLDPEADGGDAEDNGDDLGALPRLLNESLTASAGEGYQSLAGFAFLVFVLTYTPCLATVAAQVKLIGGRKTAAAVGVQLVTAWILATAVFQIGKLVI